MLEKDLMQKMKLKGVVEGDGTALKLFKGDDKNNFVALWGLVEVLRLR